MLTHDERIAALRRRLTPALQTAIQAAIDERRLPASLLQAVTPQGASALASGHAPLAMGARAEAPLGAVEAIVALVGRPPLLVRQDAVVLEPLPDLPPETPELIQRVQRCLPSVGRIEFRHHALAWGGTGWVVEHRGRGALVVTNRHVAQLVARRKADGSAVFLRSSSGVRYGGAIDFGEEVGSPAEDASRTAELVRVEYLADEAAADVALLCIEAADFALPPPLELAEAARPLRREDLVALVGYPAYDPRNDADAQARYFRDLYEVKRFAPGQVLAEPADGVLTYDCTSLGGNSGSPVLRLDDGRVVGLHFSGVYGKENTAVSAATIRDLLGGWRPVADRLHPVVHAEAPDAAHPAAHFEGREGFQPRFLRSAHGRIFPTPWPGLPPALRDTLAAPSDDPPEPGELRYQHFGVKYSATHKLPLVTAVNIDGGRAVRIKRGEDRWFFDGRIEREVQLGADNFGDPEIDRGHMVRREDPNWGDPERARLANDDTFHYVNAIAQHGRLNQGKQLWQGLENYILDSARTHGLKACVFTGPVLRGADDVEDEIEIDGALVPLEFWKLVVTLDARDKGLHSTAYLLSQGQLIRKLLEQRSRRETREGFVLGGYRTFQIAVGDLAEATGYDFSAYAASDPLRHTEEARSPSSADEPLFVPLGTLDDLVL